MQKFTLKQNSVGEAVSDIPLILPALVIERSEIIYSSRITQYGVVFEEIGGVDDAVDQILCLTSHEGRLSHEGVVDGELAVGDDFVRDHVHPGVGGGGEGVGTARDHVTHVVILLVWYGHQVDRAPWNK